MYTLSAGKTEDGPTTCGISVPQFETSRQLVHRLRVRRGEGRVLGQMGEIDIIPLLLWQSKLKAVKRDMKVGEVMLRKCTQRVCSIKYREKAVFG
jgi:hypothetical protein